MYVSIYESVPLGIAVVLLRLPPFIVTWFPTAMLPLLYHARSGQYLIRRVVVQNAAVASIPILLMRSLFAKLSSRDYLRICYKAACPGCKSVNYLFQLLVHSSISVYYKHECGAVITHPVSAHWGKGGGTNFLIISVLGRLVSLVLLSRMRVLLDVLLSRMPVLLDVHACVIHDHPNHCHTILCVVFIRVKLCGQTMVPIT